MKPASRAVLLTLATAFAALTPAIVAQARSVPYELRDGVTAPVYSYERAIRETVWVRAPDFDDNGVADRVAVDIVRPRELDDSGTEVPVIMVASPYYSCCGRGNESERKTYDADGNPSRMPLYYDNYFVPRGYAFVGVDMAGTNRSTGCVDHGGDSDILSVKAVIDWLGGRADAVDADGNPVDASWSNGNTGMIGKSYDGTIANGVAATGVDGLKTIVPIAAISSWYDYQRENGLVATRGDYPSWLSDYVMDKRTEPVDCRRFVERMRIDDADDTGELTPWWAARDYRPSAARVKASVFIVHGLRDFNVKTPQFSKWWTELGKYGVARKLWLTRLGHDDPFDSDRERWVVALHRWFDSKLMGIDNGVVGEPTVDVEVQPNIWASTAQWPASTAITTLRPSRLGRLVTKGDSGTLSWTNNPSQSVERAISTDANRNRLLFRTAPLAADIRISGTANVDLTVSSPAEEGQIAAYLVDYGAAQRVQVIRELSTQSCHGDSTPYDDACYRRLERGIASTQLEVLARGAIRLREPGVQRVRFALSADDTIVRKRNRLGLVVVSSPTGYANVDTAATRYGLDLTGSTLELPGSVAFAAESAALPTAASPKAVRDSTAPELRNSSERWIPR